MLRDLEERECLIGTLFIFKGGREGKLPYYRKLTLHEIKVLEINAT